MSKLVAGKIVTTLSRSHIVENGLVKVKKAIILESLPGGEGKDLAAWLKSREEFKGEVVLTQDAKMGYAVRESDFVVVGADSICYRGFVNKVGSLPLALISKHFGKPFVVASPSYKFLEDAGDAESAEDVQLGTQLEQPLFEFVDMDYVNFVVWEGGVVDLAEFGLGEIRKASANFFQLMG
ncbi:MAG: hypothetical protein H0Z28_07190 [Archaeoglobus sp.]|nr:hypothetical protein [Archaeoglobus sp.]